MRVKETKEIDKFSRKSVAVRESTEEEKELRMSEIGRECESVSVCVCVRV